jgi:iron complex outermembrane receptor protein
MALLTAAITGHAAEGGAGGADQPVELELITVTAAKLRSLEQFTPTGSRLGLEARETPATIDVIDSDQMLGRGYITVEESVDSLPGVTSGGSPGDPAQLSMRGFTGNQITVLHNGLYIGPANMTNRPQNVFNLESVEVLKGPASVLYGQGAIGGVVNVVNKGPRFDRSEMNFLAAMGRHGTTNFGVGGTTQWGDAVAVRADVSRNASDGYVKGLSSDSLNATMSMVWKALPTLDVQLSVDYLEDNPFAYFGAPLVPVSFATQPLDGVIDSSVGLTIDKRMQNVNYNVADYRVHSEQYWPQLLLKWMPSDNLTVQNFTYYFHAERQWKNAEIYAFNPATGLIDRDRFYVFHRQRLFGDQASLTYKGKLFGLANTFVLGFDYSHLNFLRTRGFPDGDSVDPFNPASGSFGPILQPGESVPRKSPTRWDDFAVFFENATDLTESLKLIAGGRHDRLELERENYNTSGVRLANSFTETYSSGTWRLGLVYKINDYVTPYVSWTTGKDPPGTNNIFLVSAPEGQFALSSSRQVEVGLKANTPDRRADMTLSVYDIARKDILSLDPLTGGVQGSGEQKSRGAEATGNVQVTQQWTVSANAAYTDSFYGHYFDTITGSTIDAKDNRPANIPQWTANVWTSVRNIGGLPLEIGGGVRHVGSRFANTANTVRLQSYELLNIYASYQLLPNILVIGRVNNASDKAYAEWADVFYPTQIMLGPPRSYELGVIGKF